MSSSTGSRVSAASTEEAMPMAATGPSEALEARSESRRHNRPTITVPAEAMIGSMTPRTATFIASHGLS